HLCFLLFSLFRGFRSPFLFLPNCIQRIRDAEVALMACMLEYGSIDFYERHFTLPCLRPGLGIVDRKLVLEPILGASCEAFDNLQVRAGSLECSCEGSRVEIHRLDNQRVSFPAAR